MSWPLRRALATTATRSEILVGFGGHNVAVALIDRTPARLSLRESGKDAALTDTFSIEQAAVDRTGAGLQLVEMGQAAVAAQVVG